MAVDLPPPLNEYAYCTPVVIFSDGPSPHEIQAAWRLKVFLEERLQHNINFDEMSVFIMRPPHKGHIVRKKEKLAYLPNEVSFGSDNAIIGITYKENTYAITINFLATDNFEYDEDAQKCLQEEFKQLK